MMRAAGGHADAWAALTEPRAWPAPGEGASSAGQRPTRRWHGPPRAGGDTERPSQAERVVRTVFPNPRDGAKRHFSLSHSVDENETQEAAQLVHA